MPTVYVTIGNSDDRLAPRLDQKRWSKYWHMIDDEITKAADHVWVKGVASPVSEYQNAVWGFDVAESNVSRFRYELVCIGRIFEQHSIVFATANVEMLEMAPKTKERLLLD